MSQTHVKLKVLQFSVAFQIESDRRRTHLWLFDSRALWRRKQQVDHSFIFLILYFKIKLFSPSRGFLMPKILDVSINFERFCSVAWIVFYLWLGNHGIEYNAWRATSCPKIIILRTDHLRTTSELTFYKWRSFSMLKKYLKTINDKKQLVTLKQLFSATG